MASMAMSLLVRAAACRMRLPIALLALEDIARAAFGTAPDGISFAVLSVPPLQARIVAWAIGELNAT